MGGHDIRRIRGLLVSVILMQCVFTFVYLSPKLSILDKGEAQNIHDEVTEEEVSFHMQKNSIDIGVPHQNTSNLLKSLQMRQASIAKNKFKMAMDSAKSHYEEILKLQKHLLKTQDKFTDEYYGINVSLSDTISMDRNISNLVPNACHSFDYNRDELPTASVIVPFYNEALSVLLRTVHSVLNRSPDRLLVEVILVDDLSTTEYLKDSLEEYLHMLPKVKVVRNQKREGLIRSRMIGSRMAQGDVVVFLDAHSEANEGWLEPILQEISDNPNTIAQPIVDVIDKNNIAYVSSGDSNFHVGVFGWDLKYVWMKVPDHIAKQAFDTGRPFFSPTLVGCALAANKEYFERIGEFDDGLEVWGGENIELGFRAWQCGGRITTVTCSRVGHVFKNFPHKFNNDREQVVAYNLMRVAETWMDSYRKYFYAASRTWEGRRRDFTSNDWASVRERIDMRKQMGCKSFDWFMHNLMPQVETPPPDAIFYGEVENSRTKACWEVLDDFVIGLNYVCYEHKIIPRNFFSLGKDGNLRYKDKCVIHNPPEPVLRIGECPTKENQAKVAIWSLDKSRYMRGQLQVKRLLDSNVWETFCVAQVTNVYKTALSHEKEQLPNLSRCGGREEFESWSFTWKFSWDHVPQTAWETSLIYKQ